MNITFKGKQLELIHQLSTAGSHYYGSVECDWLAYCEDEDQHYRLENTTYEENAGRVITEHARLEKASSIDIGVL